MLPSVVCHLIDITSRINRLHEESQGFKFAADDSAVRMITIGRSLQANEESETARIPHLRHYARVRTYRAISTAFIAIRYNKRRQGRVLLDVIEMRLLSVKPRRGFVQRSRFSCGGVACPARATNTRRPAWGGGAQAIARDTRAGSQSGWRKPRCAANRTARPQRDE
jgi:hypothetical protein